MTEIWNGKVVNEGDIKISFSICPDCGKPVCILRGGYMDPRNLDAMGLCQASTQAIDLDTNKPEPGARVHEFKNLAEARRRYGDYINDPRLKPGWEFAYAVARLNPKVGK